MYDNSIEEKCQLEWSICILQARLILNYTYYHNDNDYNDYNP